MGRFNRILRPILAFGYGASLIVMLTFAADTAASNRMEEGVPTYRSPARQVCEKLIRHVPPVESQTSGPPSIAARLIDADKKAKERSATVEVDVSGLSLTDPATTGEAPRTSQGHLHYRLDNGPVIATTANKLSFHGLSRGRHKITVSLAGNDHGKIGSEQTLWVTVP